VTFRRQGEYDSGVSTNRQNPLGVSVTETATARYSAGEHGPTIDAGVDARPSVYEDESEGIDNLGHHGASTLLPELRNHVRSADDVERERETDRVKRNPWLLPLGLGLGVFALMIASSPLVIWLAVRQGDEEIETRPAPQEDLMGIPVRRGLNSDPSSN
jgi:hypothetical protein